MADSILGLNRALVPFHAAGLKYLLVGAEATSALRGAYRPASSQAGYDGTRNDAAPAPGTGALAAYDQPPAGKGPADRSQGMPKPEAKPAPAPAPARSSQPDAASENRTAVSDGKPPASKSRLQATCLYSVDDWPESWQQLYRKTPGSPLVVWTYAELADDLAGRGDGSRGPVFRKVFQELRMKAGSNAFWPMRDPASEYPDNDAVFFASGIAVLRPRLVLVLSSAVPAGLGLPAMHPMLPIIHNGARHVLFKNPVQLASLVAAPDGAERVAAFVRALVRP